LLYAQKGTTCMGGAILAVASPLTSRHASRVDAICLFLGLLYSEGSAKLFETTELADSRCYPGEQNAPVSYGDKGKLSFRVLVVLFHFV